MSPLWLRDVFGKAGRVTDAFISKKERRFKTNAFGFVRFATLKEASNAIESLNGWQVKGSTLSVELAKFHKGGEAIVYR